MNFQIQGVGIEFNHDSSPSYEKTIAKLLIDSCEVSLDKEETIAAVQKMESASDEDKEQMIRAAESNDLDMLWRLALKYIFPFNAFLADNLTVLSFLIEHFPKFKDIL